MKNMITRIQNQSDSSLLKNRVVAARIARLFIDCRDSVSHLRLQQAARDIGWFDNRDSADDLASILMDNGWIEYDVSNIVWRADPGSPSSHMHGYKLTDKATAVRVGKKTK